MSVSSLRVAIADRAQEMRMSALLSTGLQHHKRKKGGWRDCPCSWCAKKREATIVIGSHAPHNYRGSYVEDIRHIWREEKRGQYRAALKRLEDEEV